jgi:hypothetical protein
MKLTNKQLIRLIRGSLNEADEPWEGPQGQQSDVPPRKRRGVKDIGNLPSSQDDQDDPGDYYSDEMSRGYDDLLGELNQKLAGLAIAVIDEYNDHPNFGSAEAEKEVADVLQAAIGLFLDGRPDGMDLPTILDEEF